MWHLNLAHCTVIITTVYKDKYIFIWRVKAALYLYLMEAVVTEHLTAGRKKSLYEAHSFRYSMTAKRIAYWTWQV